MSTTLGFLAGGAVIGSVIRFWRRRGSTTTRKDRNTTQKGPEKEASTTQTSTKERTRGDRPEVEQPPVFMLILGLLVVVVISLWVFTPKGTLPTIDRVGPWVTILSLGLIVLGVGKAADSLSETDTPYLLAIIGAVLVWVGGSLYQLLRYFQ